MNVVIVGTKPVDYISKKTGKPVKGVTLYIEREPLPREADCDGLVTDSIFISSNSPCYDTLPDIAPGVAYDFVYESDGHYCFLSKVVELGVYGE